MVAHCRSFQSPLIRGGTRHRSVRSSDQGQDVLVEDLYEYPSSRSNESKHGEAFGQSDLEAGHRHGGVTSVDSTTWASEVARATYEVHLSGEMTAAVGSRFMRLTSVTIPNVSLPRLSVPRFPRPGYFDRLRLLYAS